MLLDTVLPHPSASVTYPVGTGSDVKFLIPLLGVHLRSLFGLSWAARYLADFRRKRMRKQGKSYPPVGFPSPLSLQIGVLPNNRSSAASSMAGQEFRSMPVMPRRD